MNPPEIFSSLHVQLDWPTPAEVLAPPGAGAAVYARLARQKLAEPLSLCDDGKGATVGVLTTNPHADESDAPLGIVCHFPRAVRPSTLREAHRLAWSFCRSRLLITIEPHIIRSWSCYEIPCEDETVTLPPVTEHDLGSSANLDHLAETLHWVDLASGRFFSEQSHRFRPAGRADKTLLQNLSFVRQQLTSELPEVIAHDLLARLIFIQFLCQRRGRNGESALNRAVFQRLFEDGYLSLRYEKLADILKRKGDTYSLFKWLNEKFNGDIFPDDLSREMQEVKTSHLRLLSDFVSGDLRFLDGQRSLWPLYSLDAIPLEFISSIYEEFVTKRDDSRGVGEHYTPPHVVDFVLDRVLPWSGTDYSVRALDPACGSGTFLVKIFQRLVNRWRNAHPTEEPSVPFLRSLLENQLFGIDIEDRAIHVASFSLYLAMIDEIDPRYYWRSVRFPLIRNITVRTADFFDEQVKGIRSDKDAERFDLVVGNAPWGEASLSDLAVQWATNHDWPAADQQAGPLFLPKAAMLTTSRGMVSMIQPAGALLFNQSPTALKYRQRIFSEIDIDEIVNFSALRFQLFPEAVGPACLVTLQPGLPDEEPIAYWSPKQSSNASDGSAIAVEPHDLQWVLRREAATGSSIWSALMWGGRRDLELIHRLRASNKTLKSNLEIGAWQVTRGFQRGVPLPDFITHSDKPCVSRAVEKRWSPQKVREALASALSELSDFPRICVVCFKDHVADVEYELKQRGRSGEVVVILDYSPAATSIEDCEAIIILAPPMRYPNRLGLRILEADDLWKKAERIEMADYFPRNANAFFERPRDVSQFGLPAVILKESWLVEKSRFHCIVVMPSEKEEKLLFKQSFYGITGPNPRRLSALVATLMSSLAVHYFYLTSGRLASYRPTLRRVDLEQIPVPPTDGPTLSELGAMTVEDFDSFAFQSFRLTTVEKALVEDFFAFSLPDFKGDSASPGRQVLRGKDQERVLGVYCEWFCNVVRAAFGANKVIKSRIYSTGETTTIPYCIVAMGLGGSGSAAKPEVTRLSVAEARKFVGRIQNILSEREPRTSGIYCQRSVRLYMTEGQARDDVVVPTVYILKPNENRYWTRSMALRDADEVVADILQTQVAASGSELAS